MTQASRSLLQAFVALAIAAGIGLYAYFGIYKVDQKAEAKKEHDDRLFVPTPLDEKQRDGGAVVTEFVKLVVTAKGETTTLERAVGQPWKVTAPVRARADALVVDGLVSQLETAKMKSAVEENPDEAALQKYGFKPPSFSVQASALVGDGQEPRTQVLEGGGENSFDGSIYLRRGGEKPIFIAQGGVRWALARSTFELREKEVLVLDEPKLKSFAVKSKTHDFQVERDEKNAWALVRPVPSLADPLQVTAMLGAMKNEKAQSFPEDTVENRKALGFDQPVLEAAFHDTDLGTVHLTLATPGGIGGVKWYGLREDRSGTVLMEVSATTASHLDVDPATLRDKTLVRFKKEEVKQVFFHNADASEMAVQRASGSAEGWLVASPKQGPAKNVRMATVLWVVGSLKRQSVEEEKPKDWAKYGLGPQARYVSLVGADKELARLTIGAPVPGKTDLVYARGTGDVLAEVDATRLKDLPTTVDDLLEAAPAPAKGADAGH